jgi:hypothetical protein
MGSLLLLLAALEMSFFSRARFLRLGRNWGFRDGV